VLDVVMMGHAEMWSAMKEPRPIYANDADGRRPLAARPSWR
jgi:hypothetical protein